MNKQNASYLMIGGGALLAIGSFLPWIDVLGVTANGFEGGDGWFVLLGGLALLAAGVMSMRGQDIKWLGPVGLVVGGGVAILNYFDISDAIDSAGVGSQGFGMWIMLLGTVVGLVGVIMSFKSSSAA